MWTGVFLYTHLFRMESILVPQFVIFFLSVYCLNLSRYCRLKPPFVFLWLVVKYKKEEDSGLTNKIQKLSWHSVVKKGSRFNQRLTQLTGLVSQVNCNYLRNEPLFFWERRRQGVSFIKSRTWIAESTCTFFFSSLFFFWNLASPPQRNTRINRSTNNSIELQALRLHTFARETAGLHSKLQLVIFAQAKKWLVVCAVYSAKESEAEEFSESETNDSN